MAETPRTKSLVGELGRDDLEGGDDDDDQGFAYVNNDVRLRLNLDPTIPLTPAERIALLAEVSAREALLGPVLLDRVSRPVALEAILVANRTPEQQAEILALMA